MAYELSHSLKMIFSKKTIKDATRVSMAKCYNKVDDSKIKQFNVIAATFYEHYDEILNFYNNRLSNVPLISYNIHRCGINIFEYFYDIIDRYAILPNNTPTEK